MEIVVLLLVIALGVWLYRRSTLARAAPPASGPRTSLRAPVATTSTTPPPSSQPEASTSSRLVRLSADGRMSVVGESHYQPALQHITGGRDCHGDFTKAVAVSAVLVPEPTNPYDRNAVRVDIDRMTVGISLARTPLTISLRCLPSRAGEPWGGVLLS